MNEPLGILNRTKELQITVKDAFKTWKNAKDSSFKKQPFINPENCF